MIKNYLKIIEHYEECFEKFGDTHQGVDWPNKTDADIRYKIMFEIMLSEKRQVSLLDFGCGTGHFLEYIRSKKISNIEYTGLDISHKFISLCKEKFPGIPFICSDILENSEEFPSYDYIILNGVFTEKQELSFDEMFNYFQKLITILFNNTKIGLVFNVMSKQVDWERDDLFHLPLDLLMEFLTKNISRHFVIRNDYGLYEYSVYLFKHKLIWIK